MKKNLTFILFGILLCLSGCKQVNAPIEIINNDNLLVATLYHQKAAERNALCLQAYNIAKINLDKILSGHPDPSNLAIVLDLDETVLDNSPYEARCVRDNISYPTGWDEWIHAAEAEALPGAVEFLKYTASKGVNIFYITNRKEKYMEATLENLRKLDIAPTSEANLKLRKDLTSKEPRRQQVLENYEIIMLFGDNLADFSEVFDGEKSTLERAALVDSLNYAFGDRYIVFPNAMYGDWLNAVIDYNFGLSKADQIELQKKGLEPF